MTLTGKVHVFSALSMIDTATHFTAFVRIANNTELNVTLSLSTSITGTLLELILLGLAL
jgi:hypothetical protein